MQKKLKTMMVLYLAVFFCLLLPMGVRAMPYEDLNLSPVIMVRSSADHGYRLTKKMYKKLNLKGWWTQSSSGGYDIRFTRSKVKYYYHRDQSKNFDLPASLDGKLADTKKICGCRKTDSGYFLKLKNSSGEKDGFFFRGLTGSYSGADSFFGGWDMDPSCYSGSSSIMKGRWGSAQ